MVQEEIYNLLLKSKSPLSTSEITKELNENYKKIVHAITRLIAGKEILFRELDRELAMKFYNSKKKLRLYFVSEDEKNKSKKSNWF